MIKVNVLPATCIGGASLVIGCAMIACLVRGQRKEQLLRRTGVKTTAVVVSNMEGMEIGSITSILRWVDQNGAVRLTQRSVGRPKIGKQFTLRYNPANVTDVMLEEVPMFSDFVVIGFAFFGGLLSLIGGGLLFLVIRESMRNYF